jgi:hypothetical protein
MDMAELKLSMQGNNATIEILRMIIPSKYPYYYQIIKYNVI